MVLRGHHHHWDAFQVFAKIKCLDGKPARIEALDGFRNAWKDAGGSIIATPVEKTHDAVLKVMTMCLGDFKLQDSLWELDLELMYINSRNLWIHSKLQQQLGLY